MDHISQLHKARRMLNAIYRLAHQPDAISLSDIRYFARAGVIQLNSTLDHASREDRALQASRSHSGMSAQNEQVPVGATFPGR
ncbi:MAG: hypothetical protein FJ271_32195 [Planctomycetes bacterium]|nr:hypothetical protein [Planctomycetota bacterium]